MIGDSNPIWDGSSAKPADPNTPDYHDQDFDEYGNPIGGDDDE